MDDLHDLLAACLPADEPPMPALDLAPARRTRRRGSVVRTVGVLAVLMLIGLPLGLVATTAAGPVTGIAMLPDRLRPAESPAQISARLDNVWRDVVPAGVELLYMDAALQSGTQLVDGGIEFDGHYAYNASRLSPLISYAVGRPATGWSGERCSSPGHVVDHCQVGERTGGTVVSYEQVEFTAMAYVVRTVTLERTDGVQVTADLSVPGDRFADARFPLSVIQLTNIVADPRLTIAPEQSAVDRPAPEQENTVSIEPALPPRGRVPMASRRERSRQDQPCCPARPVRQVAA